MLVQRSRLVAVVLAFLAIVACSPMKDPAEAAIADATAALQKIGADGPKYAPAEYKVVTDQVDSMKASFDKKEYEAVLNTVRQLIPNMKLLAETVADKKRQANIALRDQWSSMSRDVPTSLAAVEARVAELSKAKKLPKGVSKDAVAGAGSAVDAAKQSWSDAQSAKTSGNVEDAVAKGKATQATLTELMASLGMSAGGTAAKK
jgi:hypothetical protein